MIINGGEGGAYPVATQTIIMYYDDDGMPECECVSKAKKWMMIMDGRTTNEGRASRESEGFPRNLLRPLEPLSI